MSAKGVEKERGLLAEGPANAAVVELTVVRWLGDCKRVPRVESRSVSVRHDVAVELAESWLGGDLDAAVAQLVIFRREGILVDADFQDRFLGRKLPAGKAVNINLSAAGPGRWTR